MQSTIATTTLSALFAAHASVAAQHEPPEPCDFAATVEYDYWTWGGTVALQWGGWWPAPPAPHSPIVAVEGSTIHFVLDASSLGGPQVEVPWCEAGTTPLLEPGAYDIVTTVLSGGHPVLSIPQGSVSIPDYGECGFAATVEPVDGGGVVTVRTGGIAPWTCTPGNPTLTVKDGVIELSLCLIEWGCGWSITPWCESATSGPLPPGIYEVVTSIRKPVFPFPPGNPCDTIVESIHRGTIEIAGPRDPGPFGDDFNAGHSAAWSTRYADAGCLAPDVVDGALRIVATSGTCLTDALRLDASVTDPGAFRDGTLRARVTIAEIGPFSTESVTLVLRGEHEGPFAIEGYRFTLSAFGGASIKSGAFEVLASAPFAVEAGVGYWMEASAVGELLELRVWHPTEQRPASPSIAVVDRGRVEGIVGVMAHGIGEATVFVDDATYTPDGSDLLDDFTKDLAAWTPEVSAPIDVLYALDAGRVVIATEKPTTEPVVARLLHAPSLTSPAAYADGTLRAGVVAGESDASLLMRVSSSGGYAARFRPAEGSLSVLRLEPGAETILASSTTTLRGDQPLVMELAAVGDRITATLRSGDGLGTPDALVEAIDGMHAVGAIGLAAVGAVGGSEPTPLRVEFLDAWFTPSGTDVRTPGDLDGDGIVGAADLAILLGAWGTTGPGDLDGDGTVGPADLAILLGAWS